MSNAESQALILVSQEGAVRTLTLNRPQALNSFTTAMHGELLAALEAAAADAGVRCVVITGAGRGFCAGQDLGDPAVAPVMVDGQLAPSAQQPDIGDLIEATYRPLALRIRSMPVPVVAAVNGVAAGAGANLALGCDLTLAARSASFIQAFAKIALVPDCGGTWLLPRLTTRQRALGLAMLGDKLPAQQAADWGLIWQCVDDAEFTATVAALAQRLAAMPVKALVETRAALDAGAASTLDQALTHEAQLQRRLGRSADYAEGVGAFFAKRVPTFTER
ncbi:enoyl-CoA hydratase-related protein [Sphaerotilus mobilis]|uniref:2-(1,2-epoxy-1,2-dihydrophenyl)acetyl-CoA isomerase n=1 Tax=Sphaerotilus mobilis TaxID=47994 RepID=A0A4Q7LSV3_9BURK|nr:enoyl-CoA hydratase-related protein [Sphaerotilus mobilis]RZS57926.1 2-(1,2-epoxy-1,2-dihydrophenyl)acetyl-CoA isomerase [Sphaerotilus mobilis]